MKQPCGCGTFVLNNGLVECTLPKCAVPYFDPITGKLKDNLEYYYNNTGNGNGNNGTTNGNNGNQVSKKQDTKFMKHKKYLPSSLFSTNATTTTIEHHHAAASHHQHHHASHKSNNLGTISMLRRIFYKEGLSGLYAGLTPTLLMGVPNTVFYFVLYEEFKENMLNAMTSKTTRYYDGGSRNQSSVPPPSLAATPYSSYLEPAIPAISGAMARLIASLVTSPLELIRTRQAARIGSTSSTSMADAISNNNPSLVQEGRMIVQAQGIKGLYSGISPTLLRDVPFSAIYWMGLETLRNNQELQHDVYQRYNVPKLVQDFLHGTVAGMIAAFCTTPLDVIKTKQQVVNVNNVNDGNVNGSGGTTDSFQRPLQQQPRRLSSIQLMKHIIQTEGMEGLWRGNIARMFKVAPACAIMIASYEYGKTTLSSST